MPIKEDIAKNKITESMLLPHLRIAGTGAGRGGETLSIAERMPAGEAVDVGDALYCASDGKVYRADNTNEKPCHFFAVSAAAAEEDVAIAVSGFLDYEDTLFTTGSAVFITSGTPNISTSPPAAITGHIYQRIGTAISESGIYISIEPEQYVE